MPAPPLAEDRAEKTKGENPSEIYFKGRIPKGYTVLRSGLVQRDKPSGHYILLQNNHNQTMALVLHTTGLVKPDPLLDKEVTRVAYHLFDHYVFCSRGYQVNRLSRHRVRLAGRRVRLTHFEVTFKDGFHEPDTIMSVRLPYHHTVIIMLGQPQVGGYRAPMDFSKSFSHFEAEIKAFKDLLDIPQT